MGSADRFVEFNMSGVTTIVTQASGTLLDHGDLVMYAQCAAADDELHHPVPCVALSGRAHSA
jgi:hypothetical protein